MNEWFDDALVRFGISGTLIALYGVADHLARRAGGVSRHAESPSPRWVQLAIFASITLYYLLIKPFGGALAGGWGNLLGIGLAFAAMAFRWSVRRGVPAVRYPAMATRMLFYFALPLAVGVPLGWVALTVPACGISAWLAVREDQRRLGQGDAARAELTTSARWIPGVW